MLDVNLISKEKGPELQEEERVFSPVVTGPWRCRSEWLLLEWGITYPSRAFAGGRGARNSANRRCCPVSGR